MSKNLSIGLLLFVFMIFSTNSYAAFPVKKATETTTSIEKSVENNNYVVNTSAVGSGKSQIVAALVCFFVGGLGIHRFYLGYTWQGVVQILTLGGLGIWVLIDFIRILIGDLEPKNGSYDTTF